VFAHRYGRVRCPVPTPLQRVSGSNWGKCLPSSPSSEPPRKCPSHLLQGAQWRLKWVLSDSSLDVVECWRTRILRQNSTRRGATRFVMRLIARQWATEPHGTQALTRV